MYAGGRKIAEAWLGSSKVFGGSSPALPAYTIRLKYTDGVIPTFTYGTATQVSSSPNVWDLTYENTSWGNLLNGHSGLLQVIAANTTGVTMMHGMFNNCTSLASVPLFDTSSVTYMSNMFSGCTSLTTVPLFDTSSVTLIYSMFSGCTSLTTVPLFDTSSATRMDSMFMNCTSLTTVPLFDTSSATRMDSMFDGCLAVQSGALALYQQASTQATPPAFHANTFQDCGHYTETGVAELSQIPTDWGGTMQSSTDDDYIGGGG